MKSKHKVKDFCLFGLPGLFCFFAVVIIPFIYGVYLTFTDWDGVSSEKHFIWFENFKGVIRDGEFWTSLLLTFKYVIRCLRNATSRINTAFFAFKNK